MSGTSLGFVGFAGGDCMAGEVGLGPLGLEARLGGVASSGGSDGKEGWLVSASASLSSPATVESEADSGACGERKENAQDAVRPSSRRVAIPAINQCLSSSRFAGSTGSSGTSTVS